MQGTPGDSVQTNNHHTVGPAAIGGGLAVLAAGCVVVRDGTVSGIERSVFRAINDLPQALYYPMGLPLQFLGVLVVGPLVAVAAFALHRRRLALGVLLATVLKLVTERLVKAVVSRERPGTSIGSDVHLRGDVSASGESFVSGHAILAAAIAGVVMPYLPGRWKALPWLLVLGAMVGRVYVGAHNPLDVVCGAGLGIAIAGVVNFVVAPRSFRRGTAAAVAAMAVTASGCASTANGAGSADEVITVGSFDFTESVVLAEVYSQGLETAGFEVERAFGIGPREFAAPALSTGLIELLPEYAGTAAEFHSDGAAEPTDDIATTRRELVAALDGEPLVVLASAPGQDVNTFVVTAETAQRLDVDELTDLGAIAGTLVFGGPPECAQRLLCLAGLADVYGITFGDVVTLDAGGPLTTRALLGGQIDVGLMFSTDPTIDELGFVELADDAGLQPAENVTPLLHASVVAEFGDDVVAVIDATSALLTTAEIRKLNGAANRPDADIAAIASHWWSEANS